AAPAGGCLMTTQAIVLLVVYLAILLACTKPLGHYISWVLDEHRPGNTLEAGLYRLCGIQAEGSDTQVRLVTSLYFN
ncbi:MAG TPA: hypothetical protein VJ508_14395, partial [Saprospiraceae bacterium]|nr:hypothetical protein [Saprospiraceae bacterium]